MTVDRFWLLWLAPVAAALVGWLSWLARRVRVRAASTWSGRLGAVAAASGRRSPPLLALVALLIVVGMAGPRWGLASGAAESRALNVAFVMDISKSMLAEDALPNRLTRSIHIARRLVQDLSGDRFGLVAFAAQPYLLSPITLDPSAIALQLDALDPSIASDGGSALGAALKMAHEVLTHASEGGDRAVVLFTDGETFDGAETVVTAAGQLAGDRIALITVPVGRTEGARIPEEGGGWHADQGGRVVITRRNDSLIAAMTEAASGEIVAADAPDPAGDVGRILNRLDRAAVRDQLAADLVPRGWLFALAALVLLALQATTRRSAALIGIALFAAPALHAQRPSTPTRLLRHGDTTAALPAFLSAAKRQGGDTLWYNAGTAAIAQADFATAIAALGRAAGSLDPDLRHQALYNLGTAQLSAARRDSSASDSLLKGAVESLRDALALEPGDVAAKYNYELARRLMRPPPPASSQSGAGKSPPPPPTAGAPPSPGEMSQSEAEQVLKAMERSERETRQEVGRKQRRGTPPTGPDW